MRVRDVLGNLYPGSLNITMNVVPGTGTTGAALFGTPYVLYENGEAQFNNLGVDSSGTGFRLSASSAGLTTTSAAFTVGPECPGIPYATGGTVSGTVTENSCRASANVYYNRYIVPATATAVVTSTTAAPLRWGIVFGDGTPSSAQTDTTPHVVPPGEYSVRLYSGSNGELGGYTLRTRVSTLGKQAAGQQGFTCWRLQTPVGIAFDDELRCQDFSHACGSGRSPASPLRLFLHPNVRATITASSGAFDPCLEVLDSQTGQQIAVDDNAGGGTAARIVLAPSPNGRAVLINVTGRAPISGSSPFTLRITK